MPLLPLLALAVLSPLAQETKPETAPAPTEPSLALLDLQAVGQLRVRRAEIAIGSDVRLTVACPNELAPGEWGRLLTEQGFLRLRSGVYRHMTVVDSSIEVRPLASEVEITIAGGVASGRSPLRRDVTRSFAGLRLLGSMSLFATLVFQGEGERADLARFARRTPFRPVTIPSDVESRGEYAGAFAVKAGKLSLNVGVVRRSEGQDSFFSTFPTLSDTLIVVDSLDEKIFNSLPKAPGLAHQGQ